MIKYFKKIKSVKGELKLGGDKSISHRAAIFSAMAKGKSVIVNISSGEDVKSTLNVLQQLGANIKSEAEKIIINGVGFKGFMQPNSFLDCGNSGTTTRLLAGLLSSQNFSSTLIGDKSLSLRPMKRIVEPLRRMGAKIDISEHHTLPITIYPSEKFSNINYEMPVASAQVKSSILIAGLHIEEETQVIENEITRNHTEKMLGLPVEFSGSSIISTSSKKYYPVAKDYFIPGDVSTSAFHIVLALLASDSELLLKNVSLNPTRTGFIEVLKQMGGNISYENLQSSSNEEYGDVLVKSSNLKNIQIDKSIIPNIIDEIPILAVAGVFAGGNFKINNANELRVKESDRIKSLCYNFKLLGLDVEEYDDGFQISGDIKNNKIRFESFGDHRIAMAFAVLSMLLEDGVEVNDFGCVNISNPHFEDQLKSICE